MDTHNDGVEFRSIPGYAGYRVGSDGSVWSTGRNGRWTTKKLSPHAKGYLVTGLTAAGKTTVWLVHKLVMLAFVGPCPEGMEVAHEDRDRTNNRLTNLRYATPSGNQGDRVRHGTDPSGTRNGRHVLTEADVVELAAMVHGGAASVAEAAERFGVSDFTARAVVSGKSWKRVPRAGYRPAAGKTATADPDS